MQDKHQMFCMSPFRVLVITHTGHNPYQFEKSHSLHSLNIQIDTLILELAIHDLGPLFLRLYFRYEI